MNRLAIVLVGSTCYAYVSACCGMSAGRPVQFGDQTNIVVWNPKTKMEHFVRKAYFSSDSADFGFIAPTPTKPALSTADDKAFAVLQSLKPKTKGITRQAAGGAASSAPQVIQKVNVGRYEATTLQSTDSKSIKNYLKKHGYTTSKDFEAWASFYAKKGWMLTAFKVRKPKPGMPLETGVIRMSFKADKPFNPYYVPKNNTGNSKATLRIMFVSDGYYGARVGNGNFWSYSQWGADVPAATLKTVAESLKLKTTDFPENPKITYFEKYRWLDGAKDDLFFQKSGQ